jgi:predicted nucleic acid-binding protein
MHIVLDSNIWISEWGLNTTKGAAIRFYIKQKQAQIALPEIIKEEVERNLTNNLKQLCEGIEKNHSQLLSVFGQLKEIVLPTTAEIQEKANSLFKELKLDYKEIPFTLESARISLQKINDKSPPSDRNQQFKDGVIWADCLNLLELDDVILVTDDKAFFKGHDHKQGIAIELEKETNKFNHKLNLYSSLIELLEEIKTDVSIDTEILSTEYSQIARDAMSSILERSGFSISSNARTTVTPFITEDPDKLYIKFALQFDCNDIRDEDRNDAQLILNGDGFFNIKTGEFQNLKSQGEELSFVDNSEERKKISNIYMSGNIVIGHKTTAHLIRYEIN